MNKDKFNLTYHSWTDDHYTTCRMDTKLDKHALSSKDSVVITSTFPDSFAAVTNSQRIQQEYEGIYYNHEGFNIPSPEYDDGRGRPCKIVSYDSHRETFDVVIIFNRNFAKHNSKAAAVDDMAGKLYRHREFPSRRVKFVGKPTTSDIHYIHGFRHEIAFPDDIFPEIWKDVS